ncbi:MAG: TM0996/MTH895 family glutaredoxin-like protein [Candidatus Atribacteria bacterium]|nr:TM0996/MTH895 family glutaredoxin-like protein [Candidatus Atribacteria bacterium]MCD6350329.1 TM0996/MTH895 family glutaredoxin-like protein [Candidatus Atribacteria bacterium]
MEIKVLGMGCPKCKSLEENTRKALQELGISANIEKIQDVNKITEYNVMFTPGLVVNGEVKVAGKVPSKEEIKKIIQECKE